MKLLLSIIVVLMISARAHTHTTGGGGGMPRIVYLKADTASPLPFSDAVRVGNMLYLSGQIGTDSSMHVISGGVEAETRQAMENIGKILKKNGASFDDVVKCTIMLADIKDWPAVNEVYRTYFRKERLPARSAFASSGLALGAKIEIECLAALP
jgi:reactive intermediate/imine deaminase